MGTDAHVLNCGLFKPYVRPKLHMRVKFECMSKAGLLVRLCTPAAIQYASLSLLACTGISACSHLSQCAHIHAHAHMSLCTHARTHAHA